MAILCHILPLESLFSSFVSSLSNKTWCWETQRMSLFATVVVVVVGVEGRCIVCSTKITINGDFRVWKFHKILNPKNEKGHFVLQWDIHFLCLKKQEIRAIFDLVPRSLFMKTNERIKDKQTSCQKAWVNKCLFGEDLKESTVGWFCPQTVACWCPGWKSESVVPQWGRFTEEVR